MSRHRRDCPPRRHACRRTGPAPGGGKPVLAVLYFDNKTGQGDLEVLRKSLADMIQVLSD